MALWQGGQSSLSVAGDTASLDLKIAAHGRAEIHITRAGHPLAAYIYVCQRFQWSFLPLRDYMSNILGRLHADSRRVVIYDQLNPHYAKYYTRAVAQALMSCAPFDVEVHHRRGYSWVVIGTKPTQIR